MSSHSQNGNDTSNRPAETPDTSAIARWDRTAAKPAEGGKLIVLTAPLTESIDHAGYFIQMAMASRRRLWCPKWSA